MDKRFEKLLTLLMALAVLILPILGEPKMPASGTEQNMVNDHPGIMRFHVIASSDSTEDQALKLAVRDYVLSHVEGEITEAIAASEQSPSSQSSHSQIMRAYISSNLPRIEAWAEEEIRRQGFDYGAEASVGVRHIPAKYYGDLFFPEGNYEALNITLGKGRGQNWWCVVFPPLCLVDSEDSAYKEEFGISEEDRLILKFKTEEILKSGGSEDLACRTAIFGVLNFMLPDLCENTI